LNAEDLSALAKEFRRVFHDSGFVLEPLETGDFLLFGPQLSSAHQIEPARFLGENVAQMQSSGARDPQLRRLSAEIEMWLHEHPVNDARRQRGEPPVTGLWLWGDGDTTWGRDRASGGPNWRDPGARGSDSSSSGRGSSSSSASGSSASTDIAFGRDAYLQGLRASSGEKVLPLPQQLADVLSYSHARRAVLVIEIGSMLHATPTWTFFDALEQIDRAFIHPAVQALRSAKLERFVLLANDHALTVSAHDRFKVWRRTPHGLSGLQ
jgi:hypothetical protein